MSGDYSRHPFGYSVQVFLRQISARGMFGEILRPSLRASSLAIALSRKSLQPVAQTGHVIPPAPHAADGDVYDRVPLMLQALL